MRSTLKRRARDSGCTKAPRRRAGKWTCGVWPGRALQHRRESWRGRSNPSRGVVSLSYGLFALLVCYLLGAVWRVVSMPRGQRSSLPGRPEVRAAFRATPLKFSSFWLHGFRRRPRHQRADGRRRTAMFEHDARALGIVVIQAGFHDVVRHADDVAAVVQDGAPA